MSLLNYTMLLRICMYKHTMYYTTLRIHKYIQKFLYTTDYISMYDKDYIHNIFHIFLLTICCIFKNLRTFIHIYTSEERNFNAKLYYRQLK